MTKQETKNDDKRTRETKIPQSVSFRLTFLLLMTTVLIVIIGCPPKKPPVAPPIIDPNVTEPNQVEPNHVDVEPNQVEPNHVDVEPNQVEPNHVDVEPNHVDVEPNQTEPNQVDPNTAGPNEVNLPPKVTFHDKCADILTKYVNDKGMVDYARLKHRKLELSRLLNEFDKLNRNEYNSWPRNDKIAFWINVYNIQMLKVVVDNYPIESPALLRLWPGWGPSSVQHIDRKIGHRRNQKLLVMDEEFTLAKIEQQFFRKLFAEPRVFFALCDATLDSPPLRNEPYYGHKLDKQLDDQIKRFLSSPRAFKIDKRKKRVYLSVLLESSMYGSEFISRYHTDKKFKDQERATRAVLNFLTNYVADKDKSFLEREIYSIKYARYDWRLNDGSKPR